MKPLAPVLPSHVSDMKVVLYPFAALGHSDFGWLDARYHFSFARYWNPSRAGFGALRVINDDKVQSGRGFAPHDHENMEIITYVRSGAITHHDSLGHEGRTAAGDVQVMSAGSGVTHSEFNREDEATTLYQIWIEPNEANVPPRWDQQKFPAEPVRDALRLLVSGQPEHEGRGTLYIHQDAAIYGGRMLAGSKAEQSLKHNAYVLASRGVFDIITPDGAVTRMHERDGLEITGAASFRIQAVEDGEILVIDVPDF
ncbi:MAG: pirin family protein [Pseudobdellovibrionaceae bacterium]